MREEGARWEVTSHKSAWEAWTEFCDTHCRPCILRLFCSTVEFVEFIIVEFPILPLKKLVARIVRRKYRLT